MSLNGNSILIIYACATYYTIKCIPMHYIIHADAYLCVGQTPKERLQELKMMEVAEVITHEEYSQKKAEILSTL